MKIAILLDRPIAFHRVFVTLTGSVKGAILLSQAVYWQPRAKQADGWWYKTAAEWEEETGLTRHEQETARKDCAKYLKTDLRGIPATLHWKVDEEALEADLFSGNSEASFAETVKLDSRKQSNINKELQRLPENTTTGEKTSPASTDMQALSVDNQIYLGVKLVSQPNDETAFLQDCEIATMNISKGDVGTAPLCMAFLRARKILPGKRDYKSWRACFAEMREKHVKPDHITAAVAQLSRAKYTMSGPYSILKTAVDIANPLSPDTLTVRRTTTMLD